MINKQQPKFSIIIPAYNLEYLIAKSVTSVLKQSYQNFELLLINDGSYDNTLQVMTELAKKDSRITVFSKINGGVSSARNLGLAHARGEFVMFLDGDDTIDSVLLQVASDEITKYSTDLLCYSFSYHSENGDLTRSYSSSKFNKKLFNGNKLLEMFFKKQIRLSVCSVIIRKEVITENQLEFDTHTKSAEDIEFLVKLLHYSKSQFYLSNDYLQYNQRKGSATNSKIENENYEVYHRMSKLLINDKVFPYFEQYLCYWFVYEYIILYKRGSDELTIHNYFSMENVLNNYKPQLNKFSIATLVFIVMYRTILKSVLMNRTLKANGN